MTLVHVAHLLLVEAAAATYGATFVKDDADRELRSVASTALANFHGDAAPETDIVVCVGDATSEILQCASDALADAERFAGGIRRVMAPVDFSDGSIDDVRVALELARGLTVPLLVLYVVGLIVMGLVSTSGPLGTQPGTVAYRVLCSPRALCSRFPSNQTAGCG